MEIDWKKKYEDAIERAKKYNIDDAHAYQGTIVKLIFPELAKSEDEKRKESFIWTKHDEAVRKEAIACLEDWKNAIIRVGGLADYKNILFWLKEELLEKQKEPIKEVEPITDGLSTEFQKQVSYLIASSINKEHEYSEGYVKWVSQSLLEYAKFAISQQEKQKPELCKSEDEKIRNEILEYFLITRIKDFVANPERRKWISYIKKQKESPMPEDTVIFQKGVAEGRRLEREDLPYWQTFKGAGIIVPDDYILAKFGKRYKLLRPGDTIEIGTEFLQVSQLDNLPNEKQQKEQKQYEYKVGDKVRLNGDIVKIEGVYPKEQKPVKCIEFDNEFENQVSHLLASVLNGEYEYNKDFIKYAVQSLLGYAKGEIKPDKWDKREKLFMKALQTTNARIGQLVEENRKLKEQKSDEWNEDIIQKAIKEVGLTQYQIDWFKTNVFPPKQEWSEEDEKRLADIFWAIRHCIAYDNKKKKQVHDWFENRLEYLRYQPKREWNEDYNEKDLQTRFAFYTYKDDPSVLYLSNVFVEEISRNHGFGTRILKAAEKVAETIGAIMIRLKVKQNSPANAWYHKNGYGCVASEDGYDWLEKNLEYIKPNKHEWGEEDDRIRKRLIQDYEEAIKCADDVWKKQFQENLNWLKSLKNRWYSANSNTNSPNMWNDDDEWARNYLIKHLTNGMWIGEQSEKKLVTWLKNLKEKFNSQLKQECNKYTWSDIDKGILKDAVTAADLLGNDENYKKEHPNLAKAFRIAKDWLEHLPKRFNIEQKPAEWSEEDKKILDSLIRLYSREYSAYAWPWANGAITYGDVVNLLKSLRPSWKPSEEQMGFLNGLLSTYMTVGQKQQLKSLIGDLKKLI